MANTQTEDESVKELMQGVLTNINQQGYRAIENEDVEGFYSLVVGQAEEVKNLLQTTDRSVPPVSVAKTDDTVVPEKIEIIFNNKKYVDPIPMATLVELYPSLDQNFKDHLGKNHVPFDGSAHITAFMGSEDDDIRNNNNAIQVLRLMYLNYGLVNESFVFNEFFGTTKPTKDEIDAMKATLAFIRKRTHKFGNPVHQEDSNKKKTTENWPVTIHQLAGHGGRPRRYCVDADLIIGLRRLGVTSL